MKLRTIATRNIFRNTRRSVLSIVAISIAAMTITILFSLLAGIYRDIEHNAWNYDAGEIRIRNLSYDQYEHLNPIQHTVEDYRELSNLLLQQPGVRAISPRIQVPSAYFQDDKQVAAIGFGLDMEQEHDYQDLEMLVHSGRLPEAGSNEIIIGTRLAEEIGVGIGDMVTFMTQTRYRSSNAFSVDVVGLAEFPVGILNSRAYILPIESAERFMLMDGGASEILIKSTRGQTAALTKEINTVLSKLGRNEISARPWTEISPSYAYLQMAQAAYGSMALMFFLLASTVVISTTMMVIHERTREIGTLSALGMSKKELIRLFFTEAAILGFVGSLLGVLLGIGITIPLSIYGINFGEYLDSMDMDISSTLYPVLNLVTTFGVFLYSFVVSMIATYPSSRRAAKLRPVEALRAE
ncbi:ABC transporter permease [Spirochaeta dissipatitropha]